MNDLRQFSSDAKFFSLANMDNFLRHQENLATLLKRKSIIDIRKFSSDVRKILTTIDSFLKNKDIKN